MQPQEILIVDDAGHGGPDPGNVNFGVSEENVTLRTALFFEKALIRNGIRVITTRRTDTQVLPGGSTGADLHERAEIANRNNATAFVSWHTDSSNPDADGVAAWIHPAAAGTRTEQLARRMVDSIAAATGQRNRGVRYADYQVLRDTGMMAILIEMGFASNAAENKFLNDAGFDERQAEAAARAVCGFFNVPYTSATVEPAQPAVNPIPERRTAGMGEQIIPTPDWAKVAVDKLVKLGHLDDTTGTMTFFRTIVIMDRLGLIPQK